MVFVVAFTMNFEVSPRRVRRTRRRRQSDWGGGEGGNITMVCVRKEVNSMSWNYFSVRGVKPFTTCSKSPSPPVHTDILKVAVQ